MLKIVFLVGAYGTGKTTYAMENFLEEDWGYVSIDKILDRIAVENKLTHSQSLEFVQKNDNNFKNSLIDMCLTEVEQYIKLGKSIVIDNSNNKARRRKQYLDIVPKEYKKEAVFFEVKDKDAWIKRLLSRNDGNKDISPQDAERCLFEMELPTYEEGFDKIIIVSNI